MPEEAICPDCHSPRCILWDDGYLCCRCGTEFDEIEHKKDAPEDDSDTIDFD